MGKPMAKKKKQRAIDAIRDIPLVDTGNLPWYHRCTTEDQADQLNEVKAAYQSGELKHSRTQIAKKLKEVLSLVPAPVTIVRFLNGETKAKTGR